MSIKSTRRGISIAGGILLTVGALWGIGSAGFVAAADGIAIPSSAATPGRVVIAYLDEESVSAAENPGAPALSGDAPESNPGPAADWERVPTAGSSPVLGHSAPAPPAPNGSAQSASAASAADADHAATPADAGVAARDNRSAAPAALRSSAQRPSPPAENPVATVARAQRASATDANSGAAAMISTAAGTAAGVAGGAGEQQTDLGPPPALDLGAAQSGPDLSSMSLSGEFKTAETPARAAALRVTEQARVDLAGGNIDGALRDLGRAVSIDPGNPFEYFYLGRAYIARGNYAQALTFFERAEIGFAARPDWLGETVGFEGACDEELGQMSDAALAYRRALGSAPVNLRARIGYSRLSGYLPSTATADASAMTAPEGSEALPPPERTAAGPAPVEAPPMPPPAPSGAAQKIPAGNGQSD